MSDDSKFEIHTVQLDGLTIEALMDILIFSAQTSAFLANREVTSGRGGKELIKLTRIANDSTDILKYLQDTVGIGEPDASSESH